MKISIVNRRKLVTNGLDSTSKVVVTFLYIFPILGFMLLHNPEQGLSNLVIEKNPWKKRFEVGARTCLKSTVINSGPDTAVEKYTLFFYEFVVSFNLIRQPNASKNFKLKEEKTLVSIV